jgi:hypothetical protein
MGITKAKRLLRVYQEEQTDNISTAGQFKKKHCAGWNKGMKR